MNNLQDDMWCLEDMYENYEDNMVFASNIVIDHKSWMEKESQCTMGANKQLSKSNFDIDKDLQESHPIVYVVSDKHEHGTELLEDGEDDKSQNLDKLETLNLYEINEDKIGDPTLANMSVANSEAQENIGGTQQCSPEPRQVGEEEKVCPTIEYDETTKETEDRITTTDYTIGATDQNYDTIKNLQ